MTSSDDRSRRRILAFTGTLPEFLDYLRDLYSRGLLRSTAPAADILEWELTASVAAHPAGKAIGFCCAMASDFASNGVRHSDDCPRLRAPVDCFEVGHRGCHTIAGGNMVIHHPAPDGCRCVTT